MEVVVTGRHIELSDRYRAHVEEKLGRLEKHDHRIIRVQVEVDVFDVDERSYLRLAVGRGLIARVVSIVLIVLISLRYSSTYNVVFRNSGYALATVFIRLALIALLFAGSTTPEAIVEKTQQAADAEG